jgi:hypothetical protein
MVVLAPTGLIVAPRVMGPPIESTVVPLLVRIPALFAVPVPRAPPDRLPGWAEMLPVPAAV